MGLTSLGFKNSGLVIKILELELLYTYQYFPFFLLRGPLFPIENSFYIIQMELKLPPLPISQNSGTILFLIEMIIVEMGRYSKLAN